jgi:hypothetical protein
MRGAAIDAGCDWTLWSDSKGSVVYHKYEAFSLALLYMSCILPTSYNYSVYSIHMTHQNQRERVEDWITPYILKPTTPL